jgi:glycosyltransferase involved in cell wall biosynthesis
MKKSALIDIDVVSPERPSLRIAVVTETYPPDINGVARTMAITVEGLRERGHTISIIRPRHPEETSPAAKARPTQDVLVKGLPIPFYKQLRMGLPATRELHRLWSVHRPDLVHIATEGPLGWSALKIARKLKLPVSTDFRTNFHAYSQHYGVGWLKKPIIAYLKKFHNGADSTMVPTEQMRDELMQVGFERLHVVPRGVNVGMFNDQKRSESLRSSWGAQPTDVVLLCVARMATEKNLHLVLQLYESLRAEHATLRLVMVGDGPLRESLQRDCPSAIFTGFLSEEHLASHYASADMFVFPSTTETFGNVSLEAMASGLPVVAFDDAAARFLIRHGENGMLAPCNDLSALQSHVLTLLQQPDRRQAMGQQARATALEMQWAKIFQQIEHIMLNLASRTESDVSFRTEVNALV